MKEVQVKGDVRIEGGVQFGDKGMSITNEFLLHRKMYNRGSRALDIPVILYDVLL